jgi:hypothetical protein
MLHCLLMLLDPTAAFALESHTQRNDTSMLKRLEGNALYTYLLALLTLQLQHLLHLPSAGRAALLLKQWPHRAASPYFAFSCGFTYSSLLVVNIQSGLCSKLQPSDQVGSMPHAHLVACTGSFR